MNINPLLLVDGYKLGHHNQYPEGMNFLFSNFTARGNKNFKKIAVDKYMDDSIVVFGTSAVVEYILHIWDENFFKKDKEGVVSEFYNVVSTFLGDEDFSVSHVEELHDLGYLPISFSSLEEGTLCSMNVPFFTLHNTHEPFAWLVNYLETQISALLWKPVTSATIARHYKVILNDYYDKTCMSKDIMGFMVHDFSMRGLSGIEDAALSGMGHLTSFSGSDNIPALMAAKMYYGFDVERVFLAGGVPATEHSVTSSNIQTLVAQAGVDALTAEKMTLGRLLSKYPAGILSYVSDTYDYFGVLTEVLPSLKEQIMDRKGKLVIRPDSGDPTEIICGKLEVNFLWREATDFENWKELVAEHLHKEFCDDLDAENPHCSGSAVFRFEGTLYKVTYTPDLNRHDKRYYYVDNWGSAVSKCKFEQIKETPEDRGTLQLLWETFGGTINEKGYKELSPHIGIIYGDSITPKKMYEILQRMKEMGFAASNVVFGAGSFTYQYVTRDTFGMAMKATHCRVGEMEVKLFKDPKTGDGSKKSAKGLFIVRREGHKTFLEDGKDMSGWTNGVTHDKLTPIILMGRFDDIRANVDATLEVYKEK